MDEEDDFIFYGTPIGREEETSARKRKAAADAGQLRALPPWKQEVRDEEGRRRFHGAFTGGFSAGYYNTVGSKEGWTPQTFTSSRKNRSEVKQQDIYSFLDEDEKAEMEGHALETSSKFDTFGFTAAEMARRQAENEQKKRPSIIPGPVPDEIVLPAANSIGMELLLKMGWRRGHSVKDTRVDSLSDARREARKAFLALSGNEERTEFLEPNSNRSGSDNVAEECHDSMYASQSTPVFVLNPKQDLHGLGYDPFKHAPEFRERKRLRGIRDRRLGTAASKENLFSSNSGKIAPGFGIGALEELDIEDEDIYDSSFEIEETCQEDIELPSTEKSDVKLLLHHKEQNVLSGFKPALSSDYKLERFRPPDIPHSFDPHHKFHASLEAVNYADSSPPPEVPPPDDNNLKMLIEGVATLVSRCGKLFEDLSKEKNKDNPLFSFLSGGSGHQYYARKLWEQQQKHTDQKKLPINVKPDSSIQKMTAESRGRILGEKPLEKSSNISLSSAATTTVQFQSDLSDTFIKPGSQKNSDSAKPFKDDPAKQERFEKFLKDKFEGGLRSTFSGGTSSWSEIDRAREILDFEAALEAIRKGESYVKLGASSRQQFTDVPILGGMQFMAGGVEINQRSQNEEKIPGKFYPKREEFQWRPAPILCKRFDIIDPFMGKPSPLPRARSRMDSLVFTSDFVKSTKTEEPFGQAKPSSLEGLKETGQVADLEPDKESADKNVQRPVDLYKAIFSDDDDDDDGGGDIEAPITNKADDPEKKIEGVNTALNRLVAGDFLESLGKELGLDVPTEESHRSTTILSVPKEAGDLRVLSHKSTSIPGTADRAFGGVLATADNVASSLGRECENQLCELSPAGGDDTHGTFCQNGATSVGHSSEVGIHHSDPGNRRTESSSRRATTSKRHEPFSKRHYDDRSTSSGDRRFRENREGLVEKDKKRRRIDSKHNKISSSSSDTDSSSDSKFHNRKATKHENKVLQEKRWRSHSSHYRSSSSESSDEHHKSSRIKSRRRKSSREKTRKHYKHKVRSKESPTNYSGRGSDRNRFDDGRERKKSRRHEKDTVSPRSSKHEKYG